jgi:hypothetical protein
MYSEEMCCSLDIRKATKSWMTQTRHAACIGEIRNAHKISVRKPRRKTTLIRSRYRWEDIKLILMKQGMRVNWINLNQDSIQQ